MYKKPILLYFAITIISQNISATTINITQNNFEKEVKNSKRPVIFGIMASWCTPCQKMKPIFENVSEKFTEICKFCKIEFNPKISEMVGKTIKSIPLFIIYNNGKIVLMFTGVKSEENLTIFLYKILESIKN